MTADMIVPGSDDLKEIISKNWITHDAMWFYHCLREFGIDKANKMNKAAIHDMSAIEIRRIKKAVGADTLESFDAFLRFFDIAMAIATGKFMKYRYNSPARNIVHAEWERCFAYEGVKALGVADRYECGVMLRINTWLDTLGIEYEVEPEVTGCMMYTKGECWRNYRFSFER